MSNRALIIIIILILAASGGVAGYFYWQQTKPLVVTDDQIKQAQENQVNNLSPQPEQNQPTSTPAMANNECKRDFSQSKLSANASIKISGRQVEMDVKDFGKIFLEFYDKDAPKAVTNFLRLVDSGYYDCLTFHRVAKGFVIQGGDPSGNGSGGQSAFGTAFADELNVNTLSYKAGYTKGVLAMANSGPNTNGSQFFIMLADNELPHLYTIFGKVKSGLDVVDKIGAVDITPQMGPTDGSPKTPVVISSVKIIK